MSFLNLNEDNQGVGMPISKKSLPAGDLPALCSRKFCHIEIPSMAAGQLYRNQNQGTIRIHFEDVFPSFGCQMTTAVILSLHIVQEMEQV